MKKSYKLTEAVVLLTAAIMILSSIVAVANTDTQNVQDIAVSLNYTSVNKNPVESPSVINIDNMIDRDQTFYATEFINSQAESFDPANPTVTTVIGPQPMSTYAGTWFDGEWYVQDYDTMIIYTLDITDATPTLVCTAGQAFNGIASDGTTMYGATSLDLYTIDLVSGTTTAVGSFGTGGLMIDIGIDMDTGICYGHDIATDSIYTIDLTTGAATLIGGTGWAANYAQGMEFDQDNDILYLALFDGAALYARLCTVDLGTGAATSIGDIGVGYYVEYGGFAIPYEGGSQPTIPDLDCSGDLNWKDVTPGDTVTGTITVLNIGEEDSLLDWEIESYPDDWGNWTFDPESGIDLLEGETTTINVEIVAPNVEETTFSGEVVLVNSEDPDDICVIQVELITPLSHSVSVLELLAQRFPILARILELLF